MNNRAIFFLSDMAVAFNTDDSVIERCVAEETSSKVIEDIEEAFENRTGKNE